jgi:lipopolysaccharide biosynthesis protein
MSLQTRAVTSIAMYLPQFHPIPENDEWWGPGFTEWTRVAGARRLYPGHYQPRLPGELGFYDLRLDESRAAQADLARTHGVTAFCYWHYWFAGRRMLDRILEEVLTTGVPDFPFCLGWANETWGGRWAGAPRRVLIEQTYPGENDHRRHFDALVEAFHDRRYLRIEGRPVFYVYRPAELPDPRRFAELWRALADKAGFPGIFLIGQSGPGRFAWEASSFGFDALALFKVRPAIERLRREGRKAFDWYVLNALERQRFLPGIAPYRHWAPYIPSVSADGELCFPSVLPGWDNTPRASRNGLVYHGATPDLFADQVRAAIAMVADRRPEHRLIFVRSWNEWAEGNYLEPDRRFGRAFLEAFRNAVQVQAV